MNRTEEPWQELYILLPTISTNAVKSDIPPSPIRPLERRVKGNALLNIVYIYRHPWYTAKIFGEETLVVCRSLNAIKYETVLWHCN
jgi:hypothetical protein